MTVVVGGQVLTATVVGGAWSVAVPTALADGTYDVQATATDNAGNIGTDNTTSELIVDTVKPTVTVNPAGDEQQPADVDRDGERCLAEQRDCRGEGRGRHDRR